MAQATPPASGEETVSVREATSLTLLAKLRANQPDAWERLDHLYGPLISYWGHRHGVSPSDIPDIKQQVYLVVVQKIKQFRRERPGDTFRGWLRGITANVIREHFKKRRGQAAPEGGTDAALRLQELPDPVVDDEDDPENEQAALLHRALQLILVELTEQEREVVRLTIAEELPAPEVAQRLKLTATNVRVMKSRLLRRLREELGEEGWTEPAPPGP